MTFILFAAVINVNTDFKNIKTNFSFFINTPTVPPTYLLLLKEKMTHRKLLDTLIDKISQEIKMIKEKKTKISICKDNFILSAKEKLID